MYLLFQVGVVLRPPGSSDSSVSEGAFGVLQPRASSIPCSSKNGPCPLQEEPSGKAPCSLIHPQNYTLATKSL